MPRRFAPHKVGLTASLAGLVSLLALAFGTVAPFRIATGSPVNLFEALGTPAAVALVTLWLACLAASLVGARSARASLARGLISAALIVALVWLSGVAAERMLASETALARYSMGAGVWLSAFSAFALVVASRREAGEGSLGSLAVVSLAPVGIVVALLTGRLSSLGVAVEYRNVSEDFWLWTAQHVAYSAVAMGIAITVGVALGIFAHSKPRFAETVFTTTSIFQTIPGLAMIGILAVPLGMLAENSPAAQALGIGVLGWAPVVVALTLYALLVIVRNTAAGLNAVPDSIVDAARGMGLSEPQILRKVQLPLSAPIVFSGIRPASQQTIGNATLGVFVAAGTLGRPIFGGVSQTANDLVLLGSIALVALALSTDIAMRGVQRFVSPRHLKGVQ